MNFVIVPNVVSAAINAALDMALEEFPEAAPDRELFYRALLEHFDVYGEIPDFSLTSRATAPTLIPLTEQEDADLKRSADELHTKLHRNYEKESGK